MSMPTVFVSHGSPMLYLEQDLPARLPAVLHVLYLMFNAGYGGIGADGRVHEFLLDEAMRLGRLLVDLIPAEPEAAGLLALMLLHDARRPARRREREFVALSDQDRSRWNRAEIAGGIALADRAARCIMYFQEFFGEVLREPFTAIAYHASRHMAATYPDRAMIEGCDCDFNKLLDFARAGRCRLRRR